MFAVNKKIVHFSLILVLYNQASSAYWRGNKDRESLQRVYGISFPDQKRLKVTYFYFPVTLFIVRR